MIRQDFNDGWVYWREGMEKKQISLPHDAMIHEKRDPAALSGGAQAFFPGGKYIYEKVFERPDGDHVLFQFEGVYKNARVLINGQEAASCAYGYLPFFAPADAFLQEGENTIRVECDNTDQPDSRWYTGAGIYRPVWLWRGKGEIIGPEALRITTLSTDPARIRVQTLGAENVTVSILKEGAEVARGEGNDLELDIPDAVLWSDEEPALYTCRASTPDDRAEVLFGIRLVTKDREGLKVNGKRVLLRGGCLHQDSGILGAAAYDEVEYRRAKKLKKAGFNAVRSAHNPANRALLDACDRLGLYVMDESWDMWYLHKSRFDYAGSWRDNWKSDLEAMVSRDYNHPSVILYSIGNEVSEPAGEEGIEFTGRMASLLHELDPGRLVTGGFNLMIIKSAAAGKGLYKEDGSGRDESSDNKMSGMNSTMFNLVTSLVGTGMNRAANGKAADRVTSPSLDKLDVAGYNYASGRYAGEGKLHPDRLIAGSETFPQDIVRNWRMVEKYPWLCGDFMWTAWDYLGEAGIGAWAYTEDGKGFSKPYPWLLADTGALDILGNPTGELFLAQAVWHTGKEVRLAVQPVNHPGVRPAKAVWRGTNAIPSWSWQGCEGNKAVVEVYADAAYARLYLNGKQVGKKRIRDCRAVFKLRYEPGRLSAEAFDKEGNLVGKDTLISARGEIRPSVSAGRKKAVKAGSVICADISLRDMRGIAESNADRTLEVSVEGGELLAFGSADPRTEDCFDRGRYRTYYGRAMAVIRAGSGEKMTVIVKDSQGEERHIIPVRA